ncbi:hypothetical protein C4564_02500 [Candidatus Microgenomates bacterium]|nr:MAG: hypothetical protein C4564_02500 [Candidatus Microgenomates bacterium]
MPTLQKREWTKEEMKQLSETMEKLQVNFTNSMIGPILNAQKNVQKLIDSAIFPVRILDAFKPIDMKPFNFSKILPTFELPEVPKMETEYVPMLRPIKSRAEYLLEEQNELLREMFSQEKRSYEYFPETTTFLTHYPVVGAVNFSTKNKEDNITTLFETFYEALEDRGLIRSGYKTVIVTRGEILEKARNKGLEADDNWIKQTKYNLKTKIPYSLHEIIQISDYDKIEKGYHFSVRVSGNFTN